jgi:glucose-6-phosphate isomerase
MLTKNIKVKNFLSNNNLSAQKKKIFKLFKNLINSNNEIIFSMKKNYKNSYNKKIILNFKKKDTVNLIGMGGSALGAKAIYNFLESPKKKFNFINNFSNYLLKQNDKKNINLIISKSGNTLETIANSNILIKGKNKNIFLTDNKKSYLTDLANKLKAEIVYHNNFIGGRYSVLSEVGMLPAELMGYKPEKFKRLNYLIKNKQFINLLTQNVSNILNLTKNKKNNLIILNYDDRSNDLFNWYQQLVAESLGKKNKGILPMVSVMPRDNHSLMQYYLDGVKNSFYTLFFVKENNSQKIDSKKILRSHYYLKNKSLNDISFSQFEATEKVFTKKKIAFRSLIIKKRNEETLGELFTFFILETILLGMAMKINPFNQPEVELIKTDTVKYLKNS